MEELKFSKHVLFIGAWRTQTVTDQLLQQIVDESTRKKGFRTILNLSIDGLDLFILNENRDITQRDKIPLQNIVDFIDNKYSSTCILAIVKDQQNLYAIFVFLCHSERDAADMVQSFKEAKNQLSGEGYKVDLKNPQGKNWTLLTKSIPIVYRSENGHIRVMSQSSSETTGTTNGTTGGTRGSKYYITEATQPNGEVTPEEDEKTNEPPAMKEELISLSNEVRDIKLMLAKSRGRHHFEQHYGYRVTGILGSTNTTVDAQEDTDTMYHTVVEPKVNTKQTIYQKNTKYLSKTSKPSYSVVREEGIVDQRDNMTHASRVTNAKNNRWYSKSRYDSGVEPLYTTNTRVQHRTVKRPAFLRVAKGSRNRPVPHVLVRTSRGGRYTDTIQKNIENVYGHHRYIRRPLSRPGPVFANQRTSEYVQNVGIPQSSVHEREIEVSPLLTSTSDVRAVYQTIKGNSVEETAKMGEFEDRAFVETESGRFADYATVQRVMGEGRSVDIENKFLSDYGTVKHVMNEERSTDAANRVISDYATVPHTESEEGRGASTERNVIYVSYSGDDDNEPNNVDYRRHREGPVLDEHTDQDIHRYRSADVVRPGPGYAAGDAGEKFVISPGSVSSGHTVSSTNFHYETKNLGNNVYHVKAGGIEAGSGVRIFQGEVDTFDVDENTVLENATEPLVVRLVNEEGVDSKDKWNELPVIVPQKVEIYYDDDGNEITREEYMGETRKVVRDSKVVHYYMDELRQSFHGERDEERNHDGEAKGHRSDAEDTDTDMGRKRSYVLDEDALYNSKLN